MKKNILDQREYEGTKIDVPNLVCYVYMVGCEIKIRHQEDNVCPKKRLDYMFKICSPS